MVKTNERKKDKFFIIKLIKIQERKSLTTRNKKAERNGKKKGKICAGTSQLPLYTCIKMINFEKY